MKLMPTLQCSGETSLAGPGLKEEAGRCSHSSDFTGYLNRLLLSFVDSQLQSLSLLDTKGRKITEMYFGHQSFDNIFTKPYLYHILQV